MSRDCHCLICKAKPGDPCEHTLARKDGKGPQPGEPLPGRDEHFARALPPNPKEAK